MNQNKKIQDSFGQLEKNDSGQWQTGDRLTRVLSRQVLDPPPIWLMRQAGRYLPEYRTLRAAAKSFLDLCLDPQRAAEITLQPVERFDFDAAILFSDILVIPHALGQAVTFVEGVGPKLDPIDEPEVNHLAENLSLARLQPVLETISIVRARLDPGKALIGFCGAPWTLATYMIAGEGTADQLPARLFAAQKPEIFQQLIDVLIEASADYLIEQIETGANVVQIFDSWAGVLDNDGFERWCVAPTASIVTKVRARVPQAKIIGFPKGAGLRLERYIAATGVDGVSIDWTVPLEFARTRLQPHVTVQGNLDPAILLAGGDALDRGVDRIMDALGNGPFVFNLGHGVLPETPVANVQRLVRRVRAGR